jgi:hypothetical protein
MYFFSRFEGMRREKKIFRTIVIPAAAEIPEKKVNTRSGGKRKELSKKYLRLLKFI